MDEFDEYPDQPTWLQGAESSPRDRAVATAPRLLARLYRSAPARLRARVLACLMRPLGTLGLAGVSAGAFAAFTLRTPVRDASITLDDVVRITGTQVLELARFAEQVSPQTIQQAAAMLAESPVGMAAFAASTALLLLRRLNVRDRPDLDRPLGE